MFIFFNVYNRLFQSAISLYMYLSSVNFHKPKRHFFFSTSEVVTNECQNFSYNLLKSTAMCYLQNIDIYLQLLIYTKFMVGVVFLVNFCIIKKSIYWIDISFNCDRILDFFFPFVEVIYLSPFIFFILLIHISIYQCSYYLFLLQLIYTILYVLLICLRTCIFSLWQYQRMKSYVTCYQ